MSLFLRMLSFQSTETEIKNSVLYVDITHASMSNENILPTSFEQLPSELFLKIFSFLYLPEILTAFSGLTCSIDSIIRLVRSAIHIKRCNDVDTINMLHSYSTQISRLLVINAETVDFTSLNNLRSLTLKYGTTAQFDSIRPQNFPMLEILYIKGNHLSLICHFLNFILYRILQKCN